MRPVKPATTTRTLIGWGAGFTVLAQLVAIVYDLLSPNHKVTTIAGVVLLAAISVCAIALAYKALIDEIDDVERTLADEARRRSAEHRARVLESIRKEQIRLVHDTLLHLFQQVAGGRGEITPEDVRRLGDESRRGLGTTDLETSPLHLALEQAIAGVGCPVNLYVDDKASLPAKVTRHLADATREAVRNVARHVPGGTANVSAVTSSQGATVTITDWGPGFDPASVPRARMGIREGIHGRMAEIGGEALIESDIVGGTAVTLTWEPIPHATRIGPSGRRWLSLMGIPALVGTALLLLLGLAGPNPAIAWGLYLATAAVIALTSRALARRGLYRYEATLANLWGVALLVANFAWLNPSGVQGFPLWTIGLAQALMLLTIPGRRWGEALLIVSPGLAVAIAGPLGLFGQIPSGAVTGSVVALGISGLVTVSVAVAVSRVAQLLVRDAEQRADETMHQEIRDEHAAEQRAWVQALDRICGPLFTGLYTGAVHPSDPAVRVEARHVEHRLRDALRLWPDGTALATALDQLRRSGWQCMLDIETVEMDEANRLATALIQLDPAVPGQQLTITRRGTQLVVTVAEPGLTPARQQRLPGARILLTDPDFTQFSC